jgi:uncharacterized protein YbbK (DUF523 family)
LKNYTSGHSKKVSDRVIEPLSFTTNYIQVWGYEVSSGLNKLFKLSRIGSVEVLDDDWAFEDKHSIGKMDIFRITSFEQYPIKLKLGLMAASLLVEEYPLGEKYLSPAPDDSSHFILDISVCGYEGVGRFILGLLDDIEIIEICPEQLGGLPTPREPSEICGDKVISRIGCDVTDAYERGAKEALKIALENGCSYAILKSRSPSCSPSGIYDGSFSGKVMGGMGITARLFKKNGIKVVSEDEL